MRKLCGLLMCVFIYTFSNGQKSFFEIEKISDKIFIAIQKKGVRVEPTVTIIVGKSFITVVEATSTDASTTALINQIKKEVSPKPIKYLVVTHNHLDHAIGTAPYKSAFPGLSIIAHVWTREKMKDAKRGARGFAYDTDQLAKGLDTSQEINKQRYLALQAYRDDILASEIALPNLTVYDSLTIHDDDLDIKVMNLGHTHTPGDLIVYVPVEKVIITGDVMTGFEPGFSEANPENWIAVLKQLEELPFDYLIGGHGKVQKDKLLLSRWKEYMLELTAITKKAIQEGRKKEEFIASFPVKSLRSVIHQEFGEKIKSAREAFLDPVYIMSVEVMVKNHLTQLWNIYSKK
jgi:cyclase